MSEMVKVRIVVSERRRYVRETTMERDQFQEISNLLHCEREAYLEGCDEIMKDHINLERDFDDAEDIAVEKFEVYA